jgi:hypothetical protein
MLRIGMGLMTSSRCVLRTVVLTAYMEALTSGRAQQTEIAGDQPMVGSPAELPDAPSARLNPSAQNEVHSASIYEPPPRVQSGTMASNYHRIIQPYQIADPLTSKEKLELSIMSRLTVSDVASTAFSAGWSQMRNSAPHYGTDSGAFGERLGALALKQTTQSIFTYGIYASMFHDDPRYYVMGRQQKNIARRAMYSAACVFITQKDDGSEAINWPKFAGIASATAITNAYYPARDRGFAQGAESFGVSLWTSILNNEIHEFIGDGLRLLRHDQ